MRKKPLNHLLCTRSSQSSCLSDSSLSTNLTGCDPIYEHAALLRNHTTSTFSHPSKTDRLAALMSFRHWMSQLKKSQSILFFFYYSHLFPVPSFFLILTWTFQPTELDQRCNATSPTTFRTGVTNRFPVCLSAADLLTNRSQIMHFKFHPSVKSYTKVIQLQKKKYHHIFSLH